MTKKPSNWDALAIGIISVFLGLISVAFTGSVFNLFFVAMVVGVLWSDSNKLDDIYQRLSEVEARLPREQVTGGSAHSGSS